MLFGGSGVAEIKALENGFVVEFLAIDPQEPKRMVSKRVFCPDAGGLGEAVAQAVAAYLPVRALRDEREREEIRNPRPRDERSW